MARVIVTGSRNWTDDAAIRSVLVDLWMKQSIILIEGGAAGADYIARQEAQRLGIEVETYWANWKHDGKRAGSIRNQKMIDVGADLVLAFPLPESVGTWDCVRRAKKAGIEVRVWPDT